MVRSCLFPLLGFVHATSEKFKTVFSLWKRIKYFPSTPHQRKRQQYFHKFENAAITGHSGYVFEEKFGQGKHKVIIRHYFRKVPFSNCFS